MIPLTVTTNIESTPWSDLQPPIHELGVVTRIGRRFACETTLALLESAMLAIRAAEDRENTGPGPGKEGY